MIKVKPILFILILFFGLSSCATINIIPSETVLVGIDFTKYSDADFLITPGEYGEKYTSIGYFYYSFYPKKVKIYTDKNAQKKSKWVGDEIDTQKKLDFVYKEVLKKGANGITHFKIKSISKAYSDGSLMVLVNGIEISGLIIKIKK